MKAIRSCRLPFENNRSHFQEPSWSKFKPKVFEFFAVEGRAALGMPSTLLLCTTASLWALVISCQNRTYTLMTTMKNSMDVLKFCMHASCPSCTTRTEHKQRTPTRLQQQPHVWHCTHHDHQRTKLHNENKKTRAGSVGCTHYTAWHII